MNKCTQKTLKEKIGAVINKQTQTNKRINKDARQNKGCAHNQLHIKYNN